MTGARHLEQHYNLDQQALLRHACALPQPYLPYTDDTAEALYQFSNAHHGLAMAQSMLANQCRPDSYMQSQSWAMQPASSGDIKPSVAASINPSSSAVYPSDQTWSSPSGISSSFNWQHAIQQAEPYILRESDFQFGRNNELLYNSVGAHNADVKGFEYTGQAAWTPPQISGLPRVANTGVSGAAMCNSVSPKSYVSDDFDNSYSPGSMPDQVSPVSNWQGFQMSSPNNGMPSPKSASYYSDVRLIGLPRMNANMPVPFAQSADGSGQGNPPQITAKASLRVSEQPHSQDSSDGRSTWCVEQYQHDTSGLPVRPRNAVGYNGHPASDTSLSSEEDDWNRRYRPSQWNSSDDTPTPGRFQGRFQARFQVPRSASAQAQRDHNDRLLIEGKKNGETYKEIKMKMVGEQPAESTLRGRYRSLTKARKDRVRKPVWTNIDLNLLVEVVQQELDRVENTLQHPGALTHEQKLAKVSWKKVADYIQESGGSYHFGNSTCKRKWLELNPSFQ